MRNKSHIFRWNNAEIRFVQQLNFAHTFLRRQIAKNNPEKSRRNERFQRTRSLNLLFLMEQNEKWSPSALMAIDTCAFLVCAGHAWLIFQITRRRQPSPRHWPKSILHRVERAYSDVRNIRVKYRCFGVSDVPCGCVEFAFMWWEFFLNIYVFTKSCMFTFILYYDGF